MGQLEQRVIDRVRREYDDTFDGVTTIARRAGVAPSTALRYIEDRDIRPTRKRKRDRMNGR